MSLFTACVWSLLHASVAAVAATLLARAVHGALLGLRRPTGRWVSWGLLLVPLLTPALVVGYAYGTFSLALVRHPELNRSLYVVLLVVRFAPIAVLVRHFAPPPPLSRQAMPCLRLSGRLGVRDALTWAVRGPGRRSLLAGAIVFLLAFQEFEIASLLGVGTWTVWLFDAQAGGLALGRSLVYVTVPVVVQLLVLLPVVALVWRERSLPAGAEPARVSWPARWLGRAWLGTAAAVGCVVPAGMVIGQGMRAVGTAMASRTILESLVVSLSFAGAAALAALVLALGLVRWRWGATALLLAVPGLLGSLVVGLAVLAVFQRAPIPGLPRLYDTPVPLLSAMMLVLLPLALLLALLLRAGRQSALQAAQLLAASPDGQVRRSGRHLRWRLRGRARFWALALLVLHGCFELSASALLAPSGATPVTVRLYNLMHYGQTPALSAMVVLTVAAFVAVVLAARGLLGGYHRWTFHA